MCYRVLGGVKGGSFPSRSLRYCLHRVALQK